MLTNKVTAIDPEARASKALADKDYQTVLNVLMDAYGNQIYRYCKQMLHERGLVEDVHQMTFVQAYESLPRFNGASSLRTWLFSIARHRCLDALKMNRRREQRVTLVEQLPEYSDQQSVTSELQGGMLKQKLMHCVRQLAPQVRSAVLLRFQGEKSYAEMASISAEKPATLQARVVRALPVLRRCLKQQGVSNESLQSL